MKLNLQNRLRNRLSKREVDVFVEDITRKPIDLNDVVSLLQEESLLFNVTWILATLSQRNASALAGFEEQILEMMKTQVGRSETAVRNALSIFKSIKIPEDIEDDLYNESFRILQGRNSPIAHRSFALYVCVKIASKHPSLKEELLEVAKITLELYGPYSPGIRSSCTKAIKMLTPY